MGLSSTLIYTSELILCSTICVPSTTRHNIHMYESEASWASVFRFDNAWSEKSCFVRDPVFFISLTPTSFYVPECHQKG